MILAGMGKAFALPILVSLSGRRIRLQFTLRAEPFLLLCKETFVSSILKTCLGVGILSISLAGCGGNTSKIKIVSAGGTVTFKGSPLADATVIFTPEKGPVAMGISDAQGKFTLATGASRGAAVGKAKISVSVPQAGDTSSAAMNMDQKPKSAQDGASFMANMAKAQYDKTKTTGEKKTKGLIPEKYASPEASGLTATISEDASKNSNIEVKLE